MRTKYIFMLTISVVLMTSQAFASYVNNADGDKTYPIGDRAIYDVVGNVKSIVQGYSKMEFDENGLLKRSNAKTIKTGNGFEIHEEFFNEEYGETTEMVSIYDKDGRCISFGESEKDITYNGNNQIVRYAVYSGWETYKYTNTYDSDGFLLKSTYIVINNDEGTTTTYTKSYKVLAKDGHGNWTKRQVTEGSSVIVEERTIEYYQ